MKLEKQPENDYLEHSKLVVGKQPAHDNWFCQYHEWSDVNIIPITTTTSPLPSPLHYGHHLHHQHESPVIIYRLGQVNRSQCVFRFIKERFGQFW